MEAQQSLRMGKANGLIDHAERRRVGGEGAIGTADPFEPTPERLLGVERLDDRLDHQVARGERLQRFDKAEPPQGCIAKIPRERALLDELRE